MSTATAPSPAATRTVPTDPRLAAFLHPDSPEVFHAVATPTALWQPDPFDVHGIHAEPRAEFERLLHRAASIPAPPAGSVLVLLGEAGSGKTHLLRAFRTLTHAEELGYCGYMQMTTEVGNYVRYVLANLLDGLEQPYSAADPRSSLARLSGELLRMVPALSAAERQSYCEADQDDAARRTDEYADRLLDGNRFARCDVELVRVMLHLERTDAKVRNRAMLWLRCQDLKPEDRTWIGGAVPRTDDADPLRMLHGLAELTDAVHGRPLVLLIDQLEDMANQSAPVERFRKVVDAVCSLTDQVPNVVVVLATLEDYFKNSAAQLGGSKVDRLLHDPEPIRLHVNRTAEEIREMAAARLAALYTAVGVPVDPANPLFPFREEHLAPLRNLRSRDVLNHLRQHQQKCLDAGEWLEPGSPPPPPPPPPPDEVARLWNDFHSQFKADVPDDEDELALVLATAIRQTEPELPDGHHYGSDPAHNFIQVEGHRPGDAIDKLLVAVCNKGANGIGLKTQLAKVKERLGDFPLVVVRTIEFPKSGVAVKQLNAMLGSAGRKVKVENADWRRMLAFDAFRKQHSARPDFAAWQRQAKPLTGLDSLQKILRLNHPAAPPAVRSTPAVPPVPPTPSSVSLPPPPKPLAKTLFPNLMQPGKAATAPPAAGPLTFGRTTGQLSQPVTFDPLELTQHAAFLGGTGSGKTTAALNLIEQLLARGIPTVMLDRKGDLCRYADPAAWTRPLSDPSREQARAALRSRLDVRVYTPGKAAGRPLTLPVVPPGFDALTGEDREQFAQFAAGGLGAMMGFKTGDADQAMRAILAKAIETLAAVPGVTVSVAALRELIEQQDQSLLAAIGGSYPTSHFDKLGQRLLTLEINNKVLLTGGEPLDVDALLGTGPHAVPKRVRLSVISTRFLGDDTKVDFWVSQLLAAVSRWCAKSPRPHLQAVFLFDEADKYLPATSKPATKGPMEDLLKRARSAGVGLFLATQSPGDLDYKCKENVRTWLLGRVKEPTALEKLKPMLAAAKGNPAGKLGGQETGAFYLVRAGEVLAVRSDESFIRTEQMAEDDILALAKDPSAEPA